MNSTNLLASEQLTKTNHKGHKGRDEANVFLQGVFGTKEDFSRPVIKDITPAIAKKLLERNTKNRGLKKRHVMWLAKQMSLGYWLFTGDSIRFSEDGYLCDKQHTLSAIIESGTTQKFIVICGLDNRVIEVLDTGVARTAGDVLHMNGITNANKVAAICKKVLLYKNDRKSSAMSRSLETKTAFKDGDDLILNMRVLDEVSANSLYIDSCNAANKYYDMFRAITTSVYGAFHFLFSEKDPDDAWEFLSKFASGVGLESDSPIYILRKRFEQEAMSNMKYDDKLRSYWFVTCWNKFRRGEKMKILQTPGSVVIPEIQ